MTSTPHRCSILIIEDEPDLRDVLRVALEADGYDVSVVENGREALKHLRSTPSTCLIVLDLFLPVLNGQRFRAAQLRDRSLAWIPVIVMSGGVEAAREARQLGTRLFVRKPIDLDEFRAVVRSVGCQRARRPEGARRVES